MASGKTYEGAIAAGAKCDSPEGNRGTATSKVPVFGSVVVAFDLDPATQSSAACF